MTVSLRELKNQILQDAKTSWPKTVLLVGLFLIGCVFWLPPLIRAMQSKSPATAASTVAAPDVGQTSNGIRTPSNVPPVSETELTMPYSWENAEELFQNDPLVKSVEVATIHNDPFRLDRDQFPPPILFTKDVEEKKPEATSQKTEPVAPKGLTLKSTIVGVKRRAAFINKKLYFEGSAVQAEGVIFRLATVYPRKIILTRDGQSFELKISESTGSDNIEVQTQETD